MAAAAALPRELESCLTHLETISGFFAARYNGDSQAGEMAEAMKQEVSRPRSLSQRLRLYGELPGLYARRFSEAAEWTGCSHEIAGEAARAAARQRSRTGDLQISLVAGTIPLPDESLSLMVRELVDNACKFSAPSTPIRLDAGPEPGYWKVAVSDRGHGMLPEQVRQIGAFQQFWNGPERPGGLGLGLVLVQTLARLHCGEVLLESEPHTGTRVTVMVPSE
jgi:signal transduction histidine kinase